MAITPLSAVDLMRHPLWRQSNMRTSPLALLVVLGCSLLSHQAHAQVANTSPVAPATKLESFDTNISRVVLKTTRELGAVSVKTGVVLVRCREILEPGSGRKEQGIALEITPKGQPWDTLLIDYDEIAPLLSAIDYLNKIDSSITRLDAFDAVCATRGGFRLAALGSPRTDAVQFAVRDARTNLLPVLFSRDEMARCRGLIDQARATLDSLRWGLAAVVVAITQDVAAPARRRPWRWSGTRRDQACGLRVTKREPNEKRSEMEFKKMGFHTFVSIKSR